MFETMYFLFIILAFVLLVLGLLLKNKDYLPAQVMLLLLSIALFASLAMASAKIEVVHCGYENVTSTTDGFNVTYINNRNCAIENYFYEENMYIFGFMALAVGVITLTTMLKFATFRGRR